MQGELRTIFYLDQIQQSWLLSFIWIEPFKHYTIWQKLWQSAANFDWEDLLQISSLDCDRRWVDCDGNVCRKKDTTKWNTLFAEIPTEINTNCDQIWLFWPKTVGRKNVGWNWFVTDPSQLVIGNFDRLTAIIPSIKSTSYLSFHAWFFI